MNSNYDEAMGALCAAVSVLNNAVADVDRAVKTSPTPVPVVVVLASGGVIHDAWAASGKAMVYVFDEDTLDGSANREDVEAFSDRVYEAVGAIAASGGGGPKTWALRLIREASAALTARGVDPNADDVKEGR